MTEENVLATGGLLSLTLLAITGLLALYGVTWYMLLPVLAFIILIICVCKWLSFIVLPCWAILPVLIYFCGRNSEISFCYAVFALCVLFIMLCTENKIEDEN